MTTHIDDQPPPIANDRPSVQSMVRADLTDREQVGIQRYGTPLQPHNGRDALVDAYQEALDLACYLRQLLAEREDIEGENARLRGELADLTGYVRGTADSAARRRARQRLDHVAEAEALAKLVGGGP